MTAEQDRPRFSLPEQGVRGNELRDHARTVALEIINDPSRLVDLVHQLDETFLQVQTHNNLAGRETLQRFVTHIATDTRMHDWTKMRDTELPLPAARDLLLMIHRTKGVKDVKKRPPHYEIVDNVARGYLNDRFDSRRSKDWRTAIRSHYRFLEASLMPNPDFDALSVWLDLLMGKHPTIVSKDSFAWRVPFLAARAARPDDEETLKIGIEIDQCISYVGHLTNRQDEVRKNARSYTPISIQIIAAVAVEMDGLDPRRGQGVHLYQQYLKVIDESNDQTLREQLTATGYRHEDYLTAKRIPLTDDVLEIANTSVEQAERWTALAAYYNQGYAALQKPPTFFTYLNKKIAIMPGSGLPFPYNLVALPTRLKSTLDNLISLGQRQESIYRLVREAQETRGDAWEIIPFSFHSVSGYAVVPKRSFSGPASALYAVNELLTRYEQEMRERLALLGESSQPTIGLLLPEADIFLTRPEMNKKSQLESLLDITIPIEQRRRALEFFVDNHRIRQDLPRVFTRTPTRAGDRYTLAEHADLPGVISTAVIRKGAAGNLMFSLQLIPHLLVWGSDAPPTISGTIDFRNNRVNVTFLPDTPQMATDQQWILERVVLHLVERSSCPSLREVEEERQRIEQRGVSLKSIPGYVGHVGGFRASGGRKQFTPQAEENFAQAIQELYGDATGISLAEVNRRHRERNNQIGMNDDRYLTYYKGRETELPQEPTHRSNPEKLI